MSTLSVDTIQGQTSATKVKLPAGSILQTLSSTKIDQQRDNSGSFVDITGLSQAITPFYSSSKILITIHVYASYNDAAMLRLMRDSTRIPNNTVGTAANKRGFAMVRHAENNEGNTYSFTHLDNPATTSATTYKVQVCRESGSGYVDINSRKSNQDYSLCSSITVQEISQWVL